MAALPPIFKEHGSWAKLLTEAEANPPRDVDLHRAMDAIGFRWSIPGDKWDAAKWHLRHAVALLAIDDRVEPTPIPIPEKEIG